MLRLIILYAVNLRTHRQIKIHIINFFKMVFQGIISQKRRISDEIILSLKGVDLFPIKTKKLRKYCRKQRLLIG